MNLAQGQLVRQRVLEDVHTVLVTAFDRELTGYARLEPQDTLLLDASGVGVLVFEDGIPVGAYHTGTDSSGPTAVTDIGSSGPYRLELYELDEELTGQIHDDDSLRVPPAMPATQLSDDTELVEQTRERAPAEWQRDEQSTSLDAVEQFLDDQSRVEDIRDRARSEARKRAEEWNFPTDQT